MCVGAPSLPLVSPSPRSQESHQKAENCLKFVSKLQEPCLELSKAEPKAIPALLPRLLHTVRIISLHSDQHLGRVYAKFSGEQ